MKKYIMQTQKIRELFVNYDVTYHGNSETGFDIWVLI